MFILHYVWKQKECEKKARGKKSKGTKKISLTVFGCEEKQFLFSFENNKK